MKIIHCEGKYDLKYINRLLSYYKINNVYVKHHGGRAQVFGNYKKNCEDEYFVIDFDNGLSIKNISTIRNNLSKFIILKIDMEHFFFSVRGSEITSIQKKNLSDRFSNFTDDEITALLTRIMDQSVTDVLVDNGNCASNLLIVLQQIANGE